CDEEEVPCCPLTDTCECIPNAEICDETETETETEACVCVEVKLYRCANGQYSRTICCNPLTDPDQCHGHCEPKEYWDAKDQSELCEAVDEELFYQMNEPPTDVGEDFVEEPEEGEETEQ
ncbi:MAG: hypothetical protein J6U64_05285, partial [Alphaproteobacteria bacterium]|nr:hypothetical protein [Alphaproteobacteria bacterium]